jgi:hypothetical protein
MYVWLCNRMHPKYFWLLQNCVACGERFGQEDQIGRIFAYCILSVFDNYRSRQKFMCYFFPWEKIDALFLTKDAWASFWVLFSPTHPVTLVYGQKIAQYKVCREFSCRGYFLGMLLWDLVPLLDNYFYKLPPYILAGFDLTTLSSSLLGGRRCHLPTPPGPCFKISAKIWKNEFWPKLLKLFVEYC